jgi:hypothetical protein
MPEWLETTINVTTAIDAAVTVTLISTAMAIIAADDMIVVHPIGNTNSRDLDG